MLTIIPHASSPKSRGAFAFRTAGDSPAFLTFAFAVFFAVAFRSAGFQPAGVDVSFLRNSYRRQPELQNLLAGCPPFGAASRRS
jgi:hypothetical protein